MSTNGVSKDVFHLLYQSDDDEEEFELLNNQSQYTKRPLIKNNNDSKIFVQNNDKRKFKSRPEEHPVISHDPKFQDSITVASRNGVVQIPKGAVPPSMVRSRSSGKVAETSFFGSGSSELSVGSSAFGVKISKEVLAEAEEAGEENFVYKKMQTGDTIQGIALQYHTTVSIVLHYCFSCSTFSTCEFRSANINTKKREVKDNIFLAKLTSLICLVKVGSL